jgi:L-asparaginase II
MDGLRVERTRGDIVESVHRVSCAVVDARGGLMAYGGNPELHTFWRSAAKPFQALPAVQDGAVDGAGFDERHLALACASHSSEPGHVELAREMLRLVRRTEDDLACGPHVPLSYDVAASAARGEVRLSPIWSNCSGKHATMLAAADRHGWPLSGYERAEHPLPQRILAEEARWTGVAAGDTGLGIDGCTTVCFALPLRAMATAYARLAVSDEAAAARIRRAMLTHPWLVAGTGRACTDIMGAVPGRLVAKIGADGIYSAALVQSGIGIALKVEDGDMRVAPAALLGVLGEVTRRWEPDMAAPLAAASLARHARPEIINTRGREVGRARVAGQLRFEAPTGARAVGVLAGE